MAILFQFLLLKKPKKNYTISIKNEAADPSPLWQKTRIIRPPWGNESPSFLKGVKMEKEMAALYASFISHLDEHNMHLITGNALIALYLGMILKKLSGVKITKEVEDSLIEEISQKYKKICNGIHASHEAASPSG